MTFVGIALRKKGEDENKTSHLTFVEKKQEVLTEEAFKSFIKSLREKNTLNQEIILDKQVLIKQTPEVQKAIANAVTNNLSLESLLKELNVSEINKKQLLTQAYLEAVIYKLSNQLNTEAFGQIALLHSSSDKRKELFDTIEKNKAEIQRTLSLLEPLINTNQKIELAKHLEQIEENAKSSAELFFKELLSKSQKENHNNLHEFSQESLGILKNIASAIVVFVAFRVPELLLYAVGGLYFGIKSLFSGKNPLTAIAEDGADYVDSVRKFVNKNPFGIVSILGNDKEFIQGNLSSDFINTNPFFQFAESIAPITSSLSAFYMASTRAVYNSYSGKTESIEEFQITTQNTASLYWGKCIFDTATILLFTRLPLQANAISRAAQNKKWLSILGINLGMSSLTSSGTELLTENDQKPWSWNWSRFLSNTLNQSAGSAVFMGSLSKARSAFIQGGNIKLAEQFSTFVDSSDGFSDVIQASVQMAKEVSVINSYQELFTLKTSRRLFGGLLHLGTATSDVVDAKAIFAIASNNNDQDLNPVLPEPQPDPASLPPIPHNRIKIFYEEPILVTATRTFDPLEAAIGSDDGLQWKSPNAISNMSNPGSSDHADNNPEEFKINPQKRKHPSKKDISQDQQFVRIKSEVVDLIESGDIQTATKIFYAQDEHYQEEILEDYQLKRTTYYQVLNELKKIKTFLEKNTFEDYQIFKKLEELNCSPFFSEYIARKREFRNLYREIFYLLINENDITVVANFYRRTKDYLLFLKEQKLNPISENYLLTNLLPRKFSGTSFVLGHNTLSLEDIESNFRIGTSAKTIVLKSTMRLSLIKENFQEAEAIYDYYRDELSKESLEDITCDSLLSIALNDRISLRKRLNCIRACLEDSGFKISTKATLYENIAAMFLSGRRMRNHRSIYVLPMFKTTQEFTVLALQTQGSVLAIAAKAVVNWNQEELTSIGEHLNRFFYLNNLPIEQILEATFLAIEIALKNNNLDFVLKLQNEFGLEEHPKLQQLLRKHVASCLKNKKTETLNYLKNFTIETTENLLLHAVARLYQESNKAFHVHDSPVTIEDLCKQYDIKLTNELKIKIAVKIISEQLIESNLGKDCNQIDLINEAYKEIKLELEDSKVEWENFCSEIKNPPNKTAIVNFFSFLISKIFIAKINNNASDLAYYNKYFILLDNLFTLSDLDKEISSRNSLKELILNADQLRGSFTRQSYFQQISSLTENDRITNEILDDAIENLIYQYPQEDFLKNENNLRMDVAEIAKYFNYTPSINYVDERKEFVNKSKLYQEQELLTALDSLIAELSGIKDLNDVPRQGLFLQSIYEEIIIRCFKELANYSLDNIKSKIKELEHFEFLDHTFINKQLTSVILEAAKTTIKNNDKNKLTFILGYLQRNPAFVSLYYEILQETIRETNYNLVSVTLSYAPNGVSLKIEEYFKNLLVEGDFRLAQFILEDNKLNKLIDLKTTAQSAIIRLLCKQSARTDKDVDQSIQAVKEILRIIPQSIKINLNICLVQSFKNLLLYSTNPQTIRINQIIILLNLNNQLTNKLLTEAFSSAIADIPYFLETQYHSMLGAAKSLDEIFDLGPNFIQEVAGEAIKTILKESCENENAGDKIERIRKIFGLSSDTYHASSIKGLNTFFAKDFFPNYSTTNIALELPSWMIWNQLEYNTALESYAIGLAKWLNKSKHQASITRLIGDFSNLGLSILDKAYIEQRNKTEKEAFYQKCLKSYCEEVCSTEISSINKVHIENVLAILRQNHDLRTDLKIKKLSLELFTKLLIVKQFPDNYQNLNLGNTTALLIDLNKIFIFSSQEHNEIIEEFFFNGAYLLFQDPLSSNDHYTLESMHNTLREIGIDNETFFIAAYKGLHYGINKFLSNLTADELIKQVATNEQRITSLDYLFFNYFTIDVAELDSIKKNVAEDCLANQYQLLGLAMKNIPNSVRLTSKIQLSSIARYFQLTEEDTNKTLNRIFKNALLNDQEELIAQILLIENIDKKHISYIHGLYSACEALITKMHNPKRNERNLFAKIVTTNKLTTSEINNLTNNVLKKRLKNLQKRINLLEEARKQQSPSFPVNIEKLTKNEVAKIKRILKTLELTLTKGEFLFYPMFLELLEDPSLEISPRIRELLKKLA